MCVDKPIQGTGLTQATARVNRAFRDKDGGLIVDYLGVATNLRRALAEHSPSDRDQAGVPIEEMVAAMLEKHDIVRGILHGCAHDSSPTLPASQLLAQRALVLDFVMADPDRASRFCDQVLALAKAYALCGARDEATAIRDDARLFTDVRAAIPKIQHPDSGRGGSGAVDIDTRIGQLVNEAVATDEVIDVYKLAGVDTPELSILSDEFLDSLAGREKPNLQMGDDTLKKIAVDLAWTVQQSVTIDWNLKHSVRAAMRSKIRRLLAKYDYPPDHEDKAIELVLQQAELLAAVVGG